VNEVVFEVNQDADGGFCRECFIESIFSEADTWEELRLNVKEAVEAFHFDRRRQIAATLATEFAE
jgi:hypothetical protein